ncbi:hypothetical protein LshimejAT787_1500200 [Lyophyllum shimeji]|uniref:Uncharacterized protein n=1 Tax=Lyophyllum shimeji TaxID=47721 RepID=A0A9P3PYB5_LYOSH|nr:hypothetical protein LshimejAT787_1500200 [Lyophyllum shimeji]
MTLGQALVLAVRTAKKLDLVLYRFLLEASYPSLPPQCPPIRDLHHLLTSSPPRSMQEPPPDKRVPPLDDGYTSR